MKLLVFSLVLVFSAIIGHFSFVYGQEDGSTTEHAPKFLAVQHVQSGLIVQIFDEMAYSLKLNGVSDKTILVADRPDRIVKSVTTSNFIGNWSTGSDSFEVNAPNAVLILDEKEGQQQDVAIVELFDPVYNSDKKTLEYNMHLDNTESIELVHEFGQATIIIDNFSPCIRC